MIAKTYRVKALGITLSSEQYSRVIERIADKGLQDLVELVSLMATNTFYLIDLESLREHYTRT